MKTIKYLLYLVTKRILVILEGRILVEQQGQDQMWWIKERKVVRNADIDSFLRNLILKGEVFQFSCRYSRIWVDWLLGLFVLKMRAA